MSEKYNFASLVSETREYFDTQVTKSASWRKNQLISLKKMFVENHELITAAVRKDLGGPKLRGIAELGCPMETDYFLDNIDSWMKPQVVEHNSFLGKSYIRHEAKGVVLIISAWNFPFELLFSPLMAAIAAGNCAILKPSEVSVHCSKLIAKLVPMYLDTHAITVVTGGVPETTALLQQPFNHIMYTGNSTVGKIVMRAASEHLTPVTLELGGKSPVYVHRSARLQTAVERILVIKFMNAGQICVAPDYVLIDESIVEEFKEKVVKFIKKTYGETEVERQKSPFFSKIINKRHLNRIKRIVDSSKGNLIVGGESKEDEDYFSPTVVINPTLEDAILKEEIFGPVLPILTVKHVDEAVKRVNKICKDPLALYVFAEEQGAIDYFLENTQSGGVCVNSTFEHLTSNKLPFGGVGNSGMGSYHGKWGFLEFSHKRSVYVKDTLLNRKAALPATPSDKLYDFAIRLLVIGFLSRRQKQFAKYCLYFLVAIVCYKAVS